MRKSLFLVMVTIGLSSTGYSQLGPNWPVCPPNWGPIKPHGTIPVAGAPLGIYTGTSNQEAATFPACIAAAEQIVLGGPLGFDFWANSCVNLSGGKIFSYSRTELGPFLVHPPGNPNDVGCTLTVTALCCAKNVNP